MEKKRMNNEKIILDLCGGSRSWSKPYKDSGYNVRLIDIQKGDDVRLFKKPKERIYGILAAPPCTHLSLAGAIYWEKKGEVALLEALSVVDACLRIVQITNPVFWCLENPVGRLIHYLGKPKMMFHPCDYGDPYSKKTLLWGEFNPPGKWFPVKPIPAKPGSHSIDEYNMKILKRPINKKTRSTIRSITPPEFAKAFFEANR